MNAEFDRCQWLLDNGYPSEGVQGLAVVGHTVRDCKDFDARLLPLMQRTLQPDKELAGEFAAAADLAPVLAKMVEDKPFEKDSVEALGKLAELHKSTKVGQRIAHLLELAQVKS